MKNYGVKRMVENVKTGVLYTKDGKKIMDIKAGDIAIDVEKAEVFIKAPVPPQHIEMTMSWHITPWDMITLVTGKRPSNNWMKMHGGIMERKVQIRKARKGKVKKYARHY